MWLAFVVRTMSLLRYSETTLATTMVQKASLVISSKNLMQSTRTSMNLYFRTSSSTVMIRTEGEDLHRRTTLRNKVLKSRRFRK